MSLGNGGAKRLILVVDGNFVERTGLSAILERSGCEALSAADATQGLELLVERGPDVILLDLFLPEGASGDFLLVKGERAADIPVIGLLRDEVTVPRQPPGVLVDDTLTKPLRTAELLSVVARYCKRREELLCGA